MTVKLPCVRPYFSQCFVLLNNHQYNCNITKSFLSVVTCLICECCLLKALPEEFVGILAVMAKAVSLKIICKYLYSFSNSTSLPQHSNLICILGTDAFLLCTTLFFNIHTKPPLHTQLCKYIHHCL